MSLLEALAEVLVNVSAAKGGGSLTRTDQSSEGGLLGQLQGNGEGGLEDLLGQALSGQGGRAPDGRAQDGLGGLLESLARNSGGSSSSGGGLDDLLGQLVGGSGAQAGGNEGLGQIIGAVTAALSNAGGSQGGTGGSFGDLLNQAISDRGRGKSSIQPSEPQEVAAGLMLRAMIQAAKSDGKFDKAEQEKLLNRLGDVSSGERQFVNGELNKPIDVDGLVREVPGGLETQVYAMSVMGIDLDNRNEAQYLDQLARGLGIDERTVNSIHAEIGAPALYR
ncbi:MAG: tellurite resistance TerB family protein [Rhizobiaceae bacterium]